MIQLLVTWGQNKKRGRKVLIYESLIALTMLETSNRRKESIASGAKQEENTLFDPQTENTFMKCIEMFGESIPSSVLQTYAID